jgi:AcrR family transcriptional regulator
VTSTDQRISDAAIRLFVEKGATGVTISELAQHANVARGTLYRNVGSVDDLFDRIVGELSDDMHRRVSATFADIPDPATRLATGIRLWVRYAHENPTLGRFAVKFGLNEEALRSWMTGPAMADVSAGISAGRYTITTTDIDSVASMTLGATISAMWMVLEGHQTWRHAGSQTAELVLRALGIDASEAHDIASLELPRLPAQ